LRRPLRPVKIRRRSNRERRPPREHHDGAGGDRGESTRPPLRDAVEDDDEAEHRAADREHGVALGHHVPQIRGLYEQVPERPRHKHKAERADHEGETAETQDELPAPLDSRGTEQEPEHNDGTEMKQVWVGCRELVEHRLRNDECHHSEGGRDPQVCPVK
jgi:hypothetical protein